MSVSRGSGESEISIMGLLNKNRKRNELGPVEHLKTWFVDFIQLPNEELVKLAFDLLKDVMHAWDYNIKDEVLVCFLTAVASHYRDNPYHSFLHACYVFHAVYMILKETDIDQYLFPHEQLALCIAALCHDVDHDGFTNQFHVNIGSEMARRYNDISVLENHHCASAFAILEKKNCAILENLPRHLQTEIKKIMFKLIIGTDMTNHSRTISDLYQLELPNGTCDEAIRILLAKAALHAADISNPVRSFEVDVWMSAKVQAEFKIQTDREKELGLPVLPHMDLQNETMKIKAEIYFIDCIVTPLWKRLAQLFPPLESCMEQMYKNKNRFEDLLQEAISEEETHPVS